ncbi:MAG: hypothetical protein RIC95_03155 [Vicingaceae bacterium]
MNNKEALVQEIGKVLAMAKSLLSKETVEPSEYNIYNKECRALFTNLINSDFDDLTKELANIGLRVKVRKIENPILRWFYYLFTVGKNDLTYQAPYLKGSTESDYFKQYIFWTKFKLEGITHNLELMEKRK